MSDAALDSKGGRSHAADNPVILEFSARAPCPDIGREGRSPDVSVWAHRLQRKAICFKNRPRDVLGVQARS